MNKDNEMNSLLCDFTLCESFLQEIPFFLIIKFYCFGLVLKNSITDVDMVLWKSFKKKGEFGAAQQVAVEL